MNNNVNIIYALHIIKYNGMTDKLNWMCHWVQLSLKLIILIIYYVTLLSAKSIWYVKLNNGDDFF